MRHAILRTLVAASLCSWSARAEAAEFQQFSSTYGALELEGIVETPLYAFPGFGMLPVVAVQVGEARLFLGLEPSIDDLYLSADVVSALGLKTRDQNTSTKSKADDFAVGSLERLSIGDLHLDGLRFTTMADPKNEIEKASDFSSVG
ncbi:MAG TPA: hypothetical protein DFR83_26770, partial [Deltaproteobacteria bacterium]|nr:hypothetical protein [Deltaproteobacteria bacterium]